MATDTCSMALVELLRKAELDEHIDVLRESLQLVAQQLMEREIQQHVQAEKHERTEDRQGYRNGYRDRPWETRAGTIPLRVPRVRDGNYFPSLLEPRRRAEKALVAVVQEAYVHGVSTRKVDDLVKALGLEGVSKSQVARLCADLDAEVQAFRERPLTGPVPYVWLDATYVKVRQDHTSVGMAVVVASGGSVTGERQILGLDVGPSEDTTFWLSFLRNLVGRGLNGVQVVISDAHQGLQAAIGAVRHGAAWQRCRVHWLRNALSLVPKAAHSLVAATIRTIFSQPDAGSTHEQWRKVADTFRSRYPKLADLVDTTEDEVLAYLGFPTEHWRQIWSNNPLERLNTEIKRRTHVVGIFPTMPSVLRLVGMILAEQHDEWQVCRRYFSAESLAQVLSPPAPLTELVISA